MGNYRTTKLIEAIQARGVAIGASATNKLRLMQNLKEPGKGFIIGVFTPDSSEKLWSITQAGRQYLKESKEEKPVEYQFFKQQGYLL